MASGRVPRKLDRAWGLQSDTRDSRYIHAICGNLPHHHWEVAVGTSSRTDPTRLRAKRIPGVPESPRPVPAVEKVAPALQPVRAIGHPSRSLIGVRPRAGARRPRARARRGRAAARAGRPSNRANRRPTTRRPVRLALRKPTTTCASDTYTDSSETDQLTDSGAG